jgi:hypothetical protein
MRPLLWILVGAAGMYVWEHYMPTPKLNTGKYKGG